MIKVNTIHNWGGGKNYGSVVAANLDELKKMLIDSNHKYVHLMQKDPWDNMTDTVQSDIPVAELSDNDIEWLENKNAPMSMYTCQRYLACRL